MEINPSFYENYYELGVVYAEEKKYSEARDVLNNLKNKKPDFEKMDEVDRILKEIKDKGVN